MTDIIKAAMREVALWQPKVMSEARSDGSLLVWRDDALGDYPERLSDRILHWADVRPDQTWMAERDARGDWIKVSYGELADLMPRVGTALLDNGLSVDRPLLILSGNSLEHAIAALSAQYVGIPSAAVAPAYALVSSDFEKLRGIDAQITPGAIFVQDASTFADAISCVFDSDIPVIAVSGSLPDRQVLNWAEVIATTPSDQAEDARLSTGPDTVAKFLFTSGTTGSPKAVIQTQRMLCSNQQMIQNCFAYMRDEPPVLVDWAPWNHVASGNKVFNMALYNGGTYYIDAGKPTPDGMQETLRNLHEISPTWYFNVPAGFERLVTEMERDQALRDTFFSKVKLIMYAGAGMAINTWDRLQALSVAAIGQRVLLATGLGSTETAPFAIFCTEPQNAPGNCGVPAPGVTMKLVPDGDKMEVRFKGPNVTPGYWRDPELSAQAFDDEGFYRMGDAMRFAVPGDAARGFLFDGRTAENFKLRTGTWVAVGALRTALIDALGGLIRDAVIAGEDQAELGALLVPFRPAVEALVDGGADMDDATLYTHPELISRLSDMLQTLAAKATGSASRVMRALVLDTPLSFDAGEVTDKGSVNQRAVLRHRPEMVETLYSENDAVIRIYNMGRKRA